MYLDKLIFIDWVIIIVVSLLFIAAISYLIINKKRGNSNSCGNCPLASSCHNKNDCEKNKKVN